MGASPVPGKHRPCEQLYEIWSTSSVPCAIQIEEYEEHVDEVGGSGNANAGYEYVIDMVIKEQ